MRQSHLGPAAGEQFASGKRLLLLMLSWVSEGEALFAAACDALAGHTD